MSYYGDDRTKQMILAHTGKKGAKWGYNKGKPNGKRKAQGEKEQGSSNAAVGVFKKEVYTGQLGNNKTQQKEKKSVPTYVKDGVTYYKSDGSSDKYGRYTDAAGNTISLSKGDQLFDDSTTYNTEHKMGLTYEGGSRKYTSKSKFTIVKEGSVTRLVEQAKDTIDKGANWLKKKFGF